MRKVILFYILCFVLSFPILIKAQSQQIPYKILLETPVKEITFDQIKTTMLRRLNEMRAEETRLHPTRKLKPLKYSDTLERAAFFFMDHKTKWFKEDGGFDSYCHFDDDNNGVLDRFKLLNIKYAIVDDTVRHIMDGKVIFANRMACGGENVVTTNVSVYEMCEAWKKSPGHWVQIINRHYTHIGIGYRKEHPVLICDFIKFDTPAKSLQKRRKHLMK
jgi:hypothetical protein